VQRDLARLAARPHDLVVVGGGITGAAIAWDASLRGLSVALLDKGDFAAATTASSSKLIHGGLRYLKTFDWALVREALQERRVWFRIAPHLVRPLPFLLPTYGLGARGPVAVGAGLTLYQALGAAEPASDPAHALDPPRYWSPAAVRRAFPGLAARGSSGGWLYHDAQMVCPERLAFAFVAGAAAHGAMVANYAEAESFLERGGRVAGVAVRDVRSGVRHEVTGRVTINATGPWGDRLLERRGPAAVALVRSKGIHLIVPALHESLALAVQTQRHFFVLPWRGHSLLATSDTPYTGDPDRVGTSEADIAELLAAVNAALPGAGLTRGHVRHFYAGLRPLVADRGVGAANTYGQSRKAAIHDHAAENLAGLFSVLGGKWTTSRHLAMQVVDRVVAALGRSALRCATATTPLPGGDLPWLSRARAQLREGFPTIDPAILDHWLTHYGSQAANLAETAQREGTAERITAALPVTVAEVRHALAREMAVALADVVFRRTGLGTLGDPGAAALGRVAEVMAGTLGWSAADKAREIADVQAHYRVVAE